MIEIKYNNIYRGYHPSYIKGSLIYSVELMTTEPIEHYAQHN